MADLAHDFSSQLRELIGRVARQDQQAFAALYQATAPQLFGIALQSSKEEIWRRRCCRRARLGMGTGWRR
jgi:hypothetical protein